MGTVFLSTLFLVSKTINSRIFFRQVRHFFNQKTRKPLKFRQIFLHHRTCKCVWVIFTKRNHSMHFFPRLGARWGFETIYPAVYPFGPEYNLASYFRKILTHPISLGHHLAGCGEGGGGPTDRMARHRRHTAAVGARPP